MHVACSPTVQWLTAISTLDDQDLLAGVGEIKRTAVCFPGGHYVSQDWFEAFMFTLKFEWPHINYPYTYIVKDTLQNVCI